MLINGGVPSEFTYIGDFFFKVMVTEITDDMIKVKIVMQLWTNSKHFGEFNEPYILIRDTNLSRLYIPEALSNNKLASV